MKQIHYNKGFSLLELLISIAIISLIIVSVSTFQKDVFSLNTTLQDTMNAQLDARHVVKTMVSEIREASSSSLGAYPIDTASSTTIVFYSDIDNDGLKDRIRYFVSGTDLKKGVVVPDGTPISYNNSNEKVTTIISDFVSSSTVPLFQYYPSTYSGTSSPLVQPVNTSDVRLVKITVIIDKNPDNSPAPLTVTSQVSIRNLKDNL